MRPPAAPALLLHSPIFGCMECFLVEKSPTALYWFENITVWRWEVSICMQNRVRCLPKSWSVVEYYCIVVTEIPSFVSLAECMVYSGKNYTKDPNV